MNPLAIIDHIEGIVRAAAHAFSVSADAIQSGTGRHQRLAWARIVVMIAVRDRVGSTHEEAANIVGLSHHANSVTAKKRRLKAMDEPLFRKLDAYFTTLLTDRQL